MSKVTKSLIISSVIVTALLSSTFALSNIDAKAGQKAPNITAEQKKAKEDKKIKVQNALTAAETDIITTFKINKNSYTKIDLSDMPLFSVGKFQSFNDISFCKKVTEVINNEMNFVPEGSFKPVILVNNKEVIFSYKDKAGKNFIKRYQLNNSSFEKKLDDSMSGKQVKVE